MDNRFQHILLSVKIAAITSALLLAPVSHAAEATDAQAAETSPVEQKTAIDIDNEVFELGIFTGMLNIEDFGSQFFAPGISAKFRASEDFFIEYNYLKAKVTESAYEKSSGFKFVDGKDRTFKHYDLLVGYNLFQGEFFPTTDKANLSTLYLVAGVGDTEFGGEANMTYTLGVGYEVAITRSILFHFDFKDYIYKSNLVLDKERSVSATQISTGLKYAF
jgi:outer membrane beta-barrel protein